VPPSAHRSHRRSSTALLAAALLAAVGAAPVARGEDEIRLDLADRPTALRLGFTAIPVGGEADKMLFTAGATFARHLNWFIDLEGTAGYTGIYRWTESMWGSSGPALDATCRVALVRRERGALTAALGAQLSYLRRFGGVGIAHLEVAFQGRTDVGIEFVAGGGVGVGLIDSRSSGKRCSWEEEGCRTQFKAGDPALLGRFAVGYAF